MMIGCFVAWKCLVAVLFFLESQQPPWPQLRHRRNSTQVSPICKHSSHPGALGETSRIWSRCVQAGFIVTFLSIVRRRANRRDSISFFYLDRCSIACTVSPDQYRER